MMKQETFHKQLLVDIFYTRYSDQNNEKKKYRR